MPAPLEPCYVAEARRQADLAVLDELMRAHPSTVKDPRRHSDECIARTPWAWAGCPTCVGD